MNIYETIALIISILIMIVLIREAVRDNHRSSKRWTYVECKDAKEYEEYVNKLGHKTVRYIDGVYVKDIDKEL